MATERESCAECYPHKAHLPQVCQRDTCDCSTVELDADTYTSAQQTIATEPTS